MYNRDAVREATRYTSRLQKGGALLDTMRQLTLSWNSEGDAHATSGVAGLPSNRRAHDVVIRAFIPRFVESEPPALWRVAAMLERAGADRSLILPLHYYATAASESLLWDFVTEELFPKAGTEAGVSTNDVLRFLERKPDEAFGDRRWTFTVATKVARGVLAALRDYGVLVGAHKKRIGTIYFPVGAFALIARIRCDLGYRGARAVSDEVWSLFFLGETAVERYYAEATGEHLLHLETMGSVTRIAFPQMSLEDYATHVAEQSAESARV